MSAMSLNQLAVVAGIDGESCSHLIGLKASGNDSTGRTLEECLPQQCADQDESPSEYLSSLDTGS
jgi:hypothetical protein